jgi:hypothetical protein
MSRSGEIRRVLGILSCHSEPALHATSFSEPDTPSTVTEVVTLGRSPAIEPHDKSLIPN